ncbi:recombination-associated protein RdgC [Candidatus Steffania adelgidicola]|uniref:recombination-associated protein RdgC n=1 Tax=Candidatus Steffania adelgidicola TaxID=1076626 RepID=UPI001D01F83B|nr:recombination-associated protein RdgC [Candidatus Steffania adelgidicola]UDG79550.1 Recombination-associated protein RdgC [Candidatus Steffania adelgidicola]
MLWFKNIILYRLNQPLQFSLDKIEQQLSTFAFTSCHEQEMKRSGWVSPMDEKGESFTYMIPGHLLLSLRTEEKILPTAVVKMELQNKIDQLENKQDRKLRKTEKNALKDEVIQTLMPRAFSRFTHTLLWLDLINHFVVVEASSFKKAEECLALLRKSIGSLSLFPLTMENPIETTLTKWVNGEKTASGFMMQDEAELKAQLEVGGIVRCKKQDLSSAEILAHLNAGKRVTKLALDWRDRVQFILSDDGTLKRLQLSNKVQEKNADIDRNDLSACLNADFRLMTEELTVLIKELIVELGGAVSQEG